MRTNIDVDDALLDEARRVTGLRTKKETVEEGLRLLVRFKEQEEILSLREGFVRADAGAPPESLGLAKRGRPRDG